MSPRRFGLLACCFATIGLIAPAFAQAGKLPSLDRVKSTVVGYFAEVPGYEPGDVISRKQVREVLDQIERLGWKPTDRAKLEQRSLDDASFLIGQFRTPAGKKFMRQVRELRLAYDRLDRLAQLPQGRNTVERLVRGPDGYKLLEYMSNAPGGQDLSRMLSHDGGGDFNKPTDKIYTAAALVKELERLHAVESAGGARRTP